MERAAFSRVAWMIGTLCCASGAARAESTQLFFDDFEGPSPIAWTIGAQSHEQAASGKHSLKALAGKSHCVTVTRGEGFFHVAGELSQTEISFKLLSAEKLNWSINFSNATQRCNMQAAGTAQAGAWQELTIPLSEFKGDKGPCHAGDILHTFAVYAKHPFYLDDLRMVTRVREAEREAARPRNLLNPVDRKTATAKIKLRILDEQGMPIPARVTLSGKGPFAPAGELIHRIRPSGQPFFHCPGEAVLDLVPGEITFTVNKGLEYRFVQQKHALKEGANPDLDIKLERWTDLRGRGFHGADAHIHPNYGEGIYIVTPADLKRMAQGEDLSVVNAMVANTGATTIYDYQHFEGRPHAHSDEHYQIYYNEEYRSLAYGHLCLWNLSELIFPVHNGFGPEGSTGHDDYPPNSTIIEKVHAQKGAVSYAHPLTTMPNLEATVFAKFTTRALPIDAALTGIDGMDIMVRSYNPDLIKHWWRLLNCHLRVPASAGTDAMPSTGNSMMGCTRVYAKSGTPLSYAKWIVAYRSGCSFVTSGPEVWLHVNGQEPGAILNGKKDEQLKLAITATAASQFGLQRIEIVSMGKVLARLDCSGKEKEALTHEVSVSHNAWIIAQAFGKAPPFPEATFSTGAQYATTSPVYCDLGRVHPAAADDAAYWMKWIGVFKEYLEVRKQLGSEEQKQEVMKLLARAHHFYEGIVKQAEGE